MKKKIGKVLTIVLMSLAVVLLVKPVHAQAATAKYAKTVSRKYTDVKTTARYTAGKHTYVCITKRSGPYNEGKATLYREKNKKKTKLLSMKAEEISVAAEYGNWLYYTVSLYGSEWQLYRYNLKTGKKYLVSEDAAQMVICKGKLYTKTFATDISSLSIYVSGLDGKHARRIVKDAGHEKMKIYNNRLYYVQRKFSEPGMVIESRVASCKLNGKGKKGMSGYQSGANIEYYTDKIMVYSFYSPKDMETKYYRKKLKAKKATEIHPTQKQLESWSREMY